MTFPDKLRLVLAVAGMLFLLTGIALDSRLVVWGAIVLLGASFLLRLYLKKKQARSDAPGQGLS